MAAKSPCIDPHSTSAQSKAIAVGNRTETLKAAATTLSRRYEQLLRTEKLYDCVFHIGGINVKCHKLILSAASPVFEAMFYGPVHETQLEIDIVDMSPEIYRLMITYIYTGVVEYESLTLEETIELYYGAEKYLLLELIADCLTTIARKLRFSNILAALELSVCLDLRDLLNVCMTFFTRCCLSDPQFGGYLNTHYLHVSRDCIKTIIAENKDSQKQLLWFVHEWCQHECSELGLQQSDSALIIDGLQLQDNELGDLAGIKSQLHHQQQQQCSSIERSYYKASRPFHVDSEVYKWKMVIKSDRFISLLGIIMPSRFTPSHTLTTPSVAHIAQYNLPTDYNESLRLEISTLTPEPGSSDGEDEDSDQETARTRERVIWSHDVSKLATKYNCDLNIRWPDGLTLAPDVEYQLSLIWDPALAYGAEYPCSLLSNSVDGIQFRDFNGQCGSIVKGLRFLNLV